MSRDALGLEIFEEQREDYALSTDPARVDVERVHRWLTTSYWSPGVTREVVARSLARSVVVSVHQDGTQVGFGRAVTDAATFAWVADVVVDEACRGRGLGRWMVGALQSLPELAGLRRWLLATRDAHGVYAPLGFAPLEGTERWMAIERVRIGEEA